MPGIEDTENMEAPCKCDCGEWFDLEDGNGCSVCHNVFCPECLNIHNTICGRCKNQMINN